MTNNFRFEVPGFQNDFEPGEEGLEEILRSRWNEDVNRLTERLLQNEPWNFTNQPALTNYYNPRSTEVPSGAPTVPITWTAYPNRIKYEMPEAGRRKHWEYADNGVPNPDYYPPGPRGWQDEYAEWSVTRNSQGQITKVAFTSETREYWYALWDVAPNIVLRLYKQLVSEEVKLEDLYLLDSSGNPIIDPQTGRPAYNEVNEWNNKSSNGLAHLIGNFNYQFGAMFLGAQSTILREDKKGNPIVDASQLVNIGWHATPNRNSDPFISARVNDLVRQGLQISLRNPIGLYIQEPNFGTFELPFDAPDDAKPSDYWKVIRGRKRQDGESYDFILHAVYEVPPELGFTVSDISIGGFPIEYGAQIAEVLQIAVIGEAIPEVASPQAYGQVAGNNLPYPAVLREDGLLKVAERSNLNMRIAPGQTIENVALKAVNSQENATIEFVGAPGVIVEKTGFREEGDSQIFILTITAAADAPLGNRSLLIKNPDGSGGPARFGMIEVASPVSSADESEIRKLFEETYASAYRTGDVDAYVAIYTKDALQMPPGEANRRGVNQIAEAFEMLAIDIEIDPKTTATEIKVMGDNAYLVGISTSEVREKNGGESSTVEEQLVWLLKKVEGSWKVSHEISNEKPMGTEDSDSGVKPEKKAAFAIEPKGSTVAGTNFEILPNAKYPQSRIKTILINAGWAVDRLQVEYEERSDAGVSSHMSEVGGKGRGNSNKFSIEPGDYITKVYGTWGRQAPGYPKEEIISLQFETHKKGKSPVFGGGNSRKEVESFVFEAPENHEIIGFLGAYGSHQNALVRLGVYCQPV